MNGGVSQQPGDLELAILADDVLEVLLLRGRLVAVREGEHFGVHRGTLVSRYTAEFGGERFVLLHCGVKALEQETAARYEAGRVGSKYTVAHPVESGFSCLGCMDPRGGLARWAARLSVDEVLPWTAPWA